MKSKWRLDEDKLFNFFPIYSLNSLYLPSHISIGFETFHFELNVDLKVPLDWKSGDHLKKLEYIFWDLDVKMHS